MSDSTDSRPAHPHYEREPKYGTPVLPSVLAGEGRMKRWDMYPNFMMVDRNGDWVEYDDAQAEITAAEQRARAEERERIALMVQETWFKLPGDDQQSGQYRHGIYEGIKRVADAIRSMADH